MYHKQEALAGRLYYQDAEDRSRSSGSGGCERKRAFGKGIYGACGKNSEHMQGTGNRLYSAQLSGGSSGAGM